MQAPFYKCVISNSIALFTFLLMCCGQTWAQGAEPDFGTPVGIAVGGANLFVVDESKDAVLRADRVSGDLTVISNQEDGFGRGPLLVEPVAIVISEGVLLVLDRNLDAVFTVDPSTGDRRILSGCPLVTNPCPVLLVGDGPGFGDPIALAVAADGSLLVVDASHKALMSVDRLTGDRAFVSSSTLGSGIPFDTPVGVTTNSRGEVFVIDLTLDAVVEVDLVTGNRTVVSGCMELPDPCSPDLVVGTGQIFRRLTGIASESRRDFVVTDADWGAVLRFNTNSGDRTIISDANTGTGPVFLNPVAIAVEPDGQLVVVDARRKAIVRVDPTSGNRTIVSNPVDVIVSPPAGIYTSAQNIDLAIIINREGEISNFSVLLDDVEVADQIMACGGSAPLSGGGTIISCPDVRSALGLQPGRHRVRVALTVAAGQQSPTDLIIRGVVWDLLD